MPETINKAILKSAIKSVLNRSNTVVPADVVEALKDARAKETNPRGQKNLDILIENARIAAEKNSVICQDTGVPTFFVKVPLGFPFEGDLREVFDEAARELTMEFPLRPMIVHPVTRYDRCDNTGKNIPLIHYEVDNSIDYMEIKSCPKGAGSGTWAQTRIFAPTEGMAAVKKFVVEAVLRAGSNPCPPFIVGVGLGGPIEEVARLATEGSFRPVNERNPEPEIAALEQELKDALNMSQIGPMGMGGDTTVLAVNVEYSGTHKPWLPAAVNINCWPGRRATVRIYKDGRVESL